MKIRYSFVSNSSSTSFIIKDPNELAKIKRAQRVEKLKALDNIEKHGKIFENKQKIKL